ncbi:MAG: ABC transporter permease [Firmicutes bacterium]|nr:ABC transporter permease [Bacillota bacterium]
MSVDGASAPAQAAVVRPAWHEAGWVHTVGAILLALVVGTGVLAASGTNPLTAYAALLSGAFGGTYALATTLVDSLPLMLVGVGVALTFQAGLVNIGGEAQYVIGCIAAAAVGIALPHLAPAAHIPLALLAAMGAGAVLGLVPGVLKAYLNVNEVVSTLMLSYATVYFGHYLLEQGPMSVSIYENQSAPIAQTAVLPLLLPGTQLSWGLVLAPVLAVAVSFFLYRTTTGFGLRMMGHNPRAARYAGVAVAPLTVLAMTVSGALGGLGGGVQILGNYHALFDGFTDNYGFTAFVVALMARNNPYGVLLASLLFGTLANGGSAMQATTGVSPAILDVIEGLIIFFIAADRIVAWMLGRRRGGGATAQPAAAEVAS